jgi:hypothetical protein
MSHPDLTSILYTLVQYLALGHTFYQGHRIFGENAKKVGADVFDDIWLRLLFVSIGWVFLTVIGFGTKYDHVAVVRDDMVLALLYLITTGAVFLKNSWLEADFCRDRSVQYMVRKYRVEAETLYALLKTFELSRFPIDSFEKSIALTEDEKKAATVEDEQILNRAKSRLDCFIKHSEALSNATAFAKSLRKLDNSDSCPSDNKSGKRYSVEVKK